MSRRPRLEDDETLVISVTPVAQGLVIPLILLVLLESFVVWLATQWSLLHRYEPVALIVLGGLPALVIATRTWRWRSHKITLTSQRVVIEGGVLGRHSTQVYLSDVFATHANQSLSERIRRRGFVGLETQSGTVSLGPVRYPAALRRLVDRTRRVSTASTQESWDEWFDEPYQEGSPEDTDEWPG